MKKLFNDKYDFFSRNGCCGGELTIFIGCWIEVLNTCSIRAFNLVSQTIQEGSVGSFNPIHGTQVVCAIEWI